MDIHPLDIVISVINIAILFLLLRLILWKHVIKFLNERAKRVNNEMEQAKKAHLDADALFEQYALKIAGIEDEGKALLKNSQQKADEEAEKILKDARNRVNNMMADAREHIETEKEQALEEAHFEVAQLATNMAARILDREVTELDNENAIDDFFKNN
ncbi:MAG: F0F1 ATP synthase subunit B [Oscillospiraceae bacterium]|nr:F0F1 ATP synthase subunit B [Oscillospiraceae bacterium]